MEDEIVATKAAKETAPATKQRRKNGNAKNGVFLAAVHQARSDIIRPKIPPTMHNYSAIAFPSTDSTFEYFPAVNFLSSALNVIIDIVIIATDIMNRTNEINFRQRPVHFLVAFDQHILKLNY